MPVWAFIEIKQWIAECVHLQAVANPEGWDVGMHFPTQPKNYVVWGFNCAINRYNLCNVWEYPTYISILYQAVQEIWIINWCDSLCQGNNESTCI